MTFDPTATQACVRVVVIQDNLAGEGLEVFTLTLGGLEGIVGRGSRSTVNVLLNDVPGEWAYGCVGVWGVIGVHCWEVASSMCLVSGCVKLAVPTSH